MLLPAVLWVAVAAFGQITSQPPLGPDQIAALEAAVGANPADRVSRVRLLRHYGEVAPGHPGRVSHVVYWLEKFPGDPVVSNPFFQITRAQNPAGHEAVRQAWARAVASAPSTPMVLVNAARFLQTDHAEEAERLLADAVGGMPESRLLAVNLGSHYALNLLGDQQALRESARAALEASRNAFVLGGAGVALPNLFPTTAAAREPNGDRSVFELAARLMARARELAPEAQELQGPMPLIEVYRAFRGERQEVLESVSDRTRIGSNVQAARLVSKPEPTYPDVGRQARIQGIVRFTITISKDGKVDGIQLVSGHPLLVRPAHEAVRQYRYEPTLLQGVPVMVVTEVDVPFTLER